MAERPWNPWRALRARPQTTFVRRRLPGGVRAACVVWPDGDTVIGVDSALGRRERNEALAHELVHLERGVGTDRAGMPDTWEPIVAREEQIVDRTVAERLVPLEDLAEWMQARWESEIVTTVLDVAERYDTTTKLAELAMLLVLEP